LTNHLIRRVIILGAIAIILVIVVQTYWIRQLWDVNERDFDRAVNVALFNVAKDISVISRSTLPAQNLINRLSSNYYVVNVNTQIDATNLDFYLRKNIEAVHLNEDFYYGIYDCHNDQMVYGNYISYTGVSDTGNIKKELPKYDKFIYYFGVSFPNRTNYLLTSMGLSIFFSVILLVTILFFIYSLLVILRQKRLSELQKDFINNMTHEFKTPISSIKVSADVFANHPLIQKDERLSKYAKIIKEQNNRLNSQVEKVLQITKIDRKILKLNLETINLDELIAAILPSIQIKVEELEGTLTVEEHAKLPIIKADTLHLTNILNNLLDNAIKYCKDKPHIVIGTNDFGKNLQLTVADQGIGIGKEYQSQVFERFYRVPTGDIHNVKGFGLGLYYVRNICKAHGWKISLDSEANKGTKVIIEIPKVFV